VTVTFSVNVWVTYPPPLVRPRTVSVTVYTPGLR
jgi:hypothetical protein